MRPKIVGEALREISKDADIGRSIFAILETQSIVEGQADLVLVPHGSDMTPAILAAESLPPRQQAPPQQG